MNITAKSMLDSDERAPRLTLRERLVRERREELIDAARDTFARQGYHAASLKEIAQAAGVTDGLLIHYFGSKANLLRAVLAERHSLLAEVERIVDEAPDDDPALALRTVASRWLAILQGTRRSLMGVLIGEARSNPDVAEALAEHSRHAVEPVEQLLTRLTAKGLIRTEHLPVAARIFQWSLVWYAFGREASPSYYLPEPEEWIEGLVATLLDGLNARP